LGESDTTITTVDIDGINMLAIQALERRTNALRQALAEVDVLAQARREQQAEIETLKKRLAHLEAMLPTSAASLQSAPKR
ncbi:MAG: peptidase S74, partial [Rhodothermales bacterium]